MRKQVFSDGDRKKGEEQYGASHFIVSLLVFELELFKIGYSFLGKYEKVRGRTFLE